MTLREQLALKLAEAKKAYEAGDVERGDELKKEAETIKAAIDGMAALDELTPATKTPAMRPGLPGAGEGARPASPAQKAADAEAEAEAQRREVMKAVYVTRFGEEDAMKSAVMADLVGSEYEQTLWDQFAAFGRYLRAGEDALDYEQKKLLRAQVFPWHDIEEMVKNGYSVAEIKTTMVEAQGTLGGYAVPPTMQSEIIRRLPGLTAVRGGGARVYNLTTGNSTEFLEVTGGNDRYTSGLRGAWGSETQNPDDRNITFGEKQANAHIYTYKVTLSQSLVEDVANIVSILQDEMVTTLALDEDEAFLVGDGVGKPLGILPGGLNTLGLREVKSGQATALTSDGIKRLKRAVASQYRSGTTWVANSDTFGEIELLKDGEGRYLYSDLSENDRLLNRRAFESEAMPDVAGNAYPLIHGNMAGYGIVERTGMTIARYQDSQTTINRVQFQLRRRVGGRLLYPWMFAVQKVAA